MTAIGKLIDLYRTQAHLLWRWSGGWPAVAAHAALIVLSSLAAFALATRLVPGISVGSPAAAAAAAVVLALVSTLTRPVLIGLLSGFSVMLVALGTLAVQAVALLALAGLSLGIAVDGPSSAIVASLVYAVTHTLLAAGLSIANDDSFFGTLVRQLAVRHPRSGAATGPGVICIQIDGLSNPMLKRRLERGGVPTLARWLGSGDFTLDQWEASLPTQTSASQAGILHGNNDGIPAFRWWEKDSRHLYVSNHPKDAREMMRRVSDGHGLLVGGTSIGNLLAGDAARSFLTAATFDAPAQEARRSHVLDWFFVSPYAYVRWILLSIGEILKELAQARGARLGNVQPRGARGFPYPLARAATNVILRHLETALVIEEMYRSAPVIYVDFTDYDEIAHHAGIARVEAHEALEGIDRIIAIIEKASLDAPRPYRFIVLSDHGQSPGAMFRQRYGIRLEEQIEQHMGDDVRTHAAADPEHAGRMGMLLGAGPAFLTRLGRARADGANDTEPPDLVVAASGNLAQVAFPGIAGRATREAIEARYPGLIDVVAHHPGIGVVVVRSSVGGSVAIGPAGATSLADGRVDGADPLTQYGPRALADLRRVDAMPNCGDLVVISRFDEASGEVAAFEDQIGSHGGLGGWQTEAFVLHPRAWALAGPIVGAPALHRVLRSWLADAAGAVRSPVHDA